MRHSSITLTLMAALSCVLAVLPASAQNEIQIHGVPVMTAGKSCLPGQSVVGFAADDNVLCSCSPGHALCTSACFDLQTDSNNCGACGNACSAIQNQKCVEGTCRGCDVLTQYCPPGEGCYAIFTAVRQTQCVVTADPEEGDGTQGDNCSYINTCAEGYGCLLPTIPLPQLECARYCDASNKWSPEGHARCEAEAGTGFKCGSLSEIFPGEEDAFFGICAGPEWFPQAVVPAGNQASDAASP